MNTSPNTATNYEEAIVIKDWVFLADGVEYSDGLTIGAEYMERATAVGRPECAFTAMKFYLSDKLDGIDTVQFYWMKGVCRIPLKSLWSFEPFVRYAEGPSGSYEGGKQHTFLLKPNPSGPGFIAKAVEQTKFSPQQPDGQSARQGMAVPFQLMYRIDGAEYHFAI